MRSTKLDGVFRRLDEVRKRQEAIEANAASASIYRTNDVNNGKVWLASYRTLGDNSAKVILGSIAPITATIASNAVPYLTDGKMSAYVASFSSLNSTTRLGSTTIHYGSVFAVKPKLQFQRATDEVIAKYKMLGNTQYLDVELEKVWDRKEINGESYLVRVNELNPEEILRTSLMARTETSYKVSPDAFVVTRDAMPNDFVEYFGLYASVESDDLFPFMDVAKVIANNGDSLSVQVEDGACITDAILPADCVRTVVKSSSEERHLTRQEVLDFLYKCYGPKYKEIIQKTGAFQAPAV